MPSLCRDLPDLQWLAPCHPKRPCTPPQSNETSLLLGDEPLFHGTLKNLRHPAIIIVHKDAHGVLRTADPQIEQRHSFRVRIAARRRWVSTTSQ